MYIVISNRFVRPVTVVRKEGDMCIIRFDDGDGGTRVRASRLYPCMEDAEKAAGIVHREESKGIFAKPKSFAGPWAYWH